MCIKCFELSGIWPLSKDAMLAGIVGKEPPSTKEVVHSVAASLVSAVLDSDRNILKLKRDGVDPDAATAVLCNMQLFSTLEAMGSRSRKGGQFLDEAAASNLQGGGLRLTLNKMKEINLQKDAIKEMKMKKKIDEAARKESEKAAKRKYKEDQKAVERERRQELKEAAARRRIEDREAKALEQPRVRRRRSLLGFVEQVV